VLLIDIGAYNRILSIERIGGITKIDKIVHENIIPAGAEAYMLCCKPFQSWTSDACFGGYREVYTIAYMKVKQ